MEGNESIQRERFMMGRFRTCFRSRLFAVKLLVSSLLIYSAYFLLFLLLEPDVEFESSLKRTRINSILRKEHKKVALKECHVERYNSSIPLSPYGCQRLTPVSGSCQLADKLFFSSPADTCKHQLKSNICHFTESGTNVAVKCSESICVDKKVSLGQIDPETGDLQWQDFPSTQHLERHLRALFVKKTDHYGFCFIRCAINIEEITDEEAYEVVNSFNAMEEYIEIDDIAQQLLIMPPYINKGQQSLTDININILFIDSVSHSHFLRSMPKTLQTLHGFWETSVFNFELFQSLKGRTYETLQALFSGELYDVEKPFGTQDMPPTPVKLSRILSGFKKQGYETMYTEDLCWLWEWGLVKNLLAYMPGYDIKSRWELFKVALQKAGIDRIDMTLASCEILHDNHHHDPFHGPPALCYNGQYQHHYILEYLRKRQVLLEANHKPFFHNTLLNVAHDDHGRRIQTLDGDLANYVKTVSELHNTFTIILSDHGNTYGEFIKRSEEARVEMFHPVLFMIVPPDVSKTLGEKRMNALKVNQQRLVSILDIHYALRVLSEGKVEQLDKKHEKYSIKSDGIFSEIALNRSCCDIPRIEPNVCICQDFEVAAANDATYALMAEFALGSINNAIQQQFRKSNPDAMRGFGACVRLVGHRFGNIKQRYNKIGDHEVKMDLYIPTPDNSSLMEIFMVILEVSRKGGMKLVTYERMTPYSQFEGCADQGVATKLCVCSLKKMHEHVDLEEMPDLSSYHSVFGSKTLREPIHEQCLFIFKRKNHAGVVLEAANLCTNKKYAIKINITTVNMTLSSASPVKSDLWPGMMSFLVVMAQNALGWDYEYTVTFKLTDVKL